jgi:hypothetical protein
MNCLLASGWICGNEESINTPRVFETTEHTLEVNTLLYLAVSGGELGFLSNA